jgi:hypothetical protein
MKKHKMSINLFPVFVAVSIFSGGCNDGKKMYKTMERIVRILLHGKQVSFYQNH